MKRISHYLVPFFLFGGCSLLFDAALVESLDFPWPEGTPILDPISDEVRVIHEDPGRLAVVQGRACLQSDRPDSREDFVRARHTIRFADLLTNDSRWITDGTVFLNGWQARFVNNNHNPRGVVVAIARIDQRRNEVIFEAGGALSNYEFDAGYEICYGYTVLGWAASALELAVDHSDQPNTAFLTPDTNPAGTVSNAITRYRDGLSFPGADPNVGILPRGFGMAWHAAVPQWLQGSYVLGAPAPYRDPAHGYSEQDPPALPADTAHVHDGGLSWASQFVWNGDGGRRDTYLGEMVSPAGGAGIEQITPPFAPVIRRIEECGGWFTGCIGPSSVNEPLDRMVNVDHLTYDYAIPMLTGWDIGYANGDHSILQIGVEIADFSYKSPAQTGAAGVLSYQVKASTETAEVFTPVLDPNISILGFNFVSNAGGGGSNGDPIDAPDPGPATDE